MTAETRIQAVYTVDRQLNMLARFMELQGQESAWTPTQQLEYADIQTRLGWMRGIRVEEEELPPDVDPPLPSTPTNAELIAAAGPLLAAFLAVYATDTGRTKRELRDLILAEM